MIPGMVFVNLTYDMAVNTQLHIFLRKVVRACFTYIYPHEEQINSVTRHTILQSGTPAKAVSHKIVSSNRGVVHTSSVQCLAERGYPHYNGMVQYKVTLVTALNWDAAL